MQDFCNRRLIAVICISWLSMAVGLPGDTPSWAAPPSSGHALKALVTESGGSAIGPVQKNKMRREKKALSSKQSIKRQLSGTPNLTETIANLLSSRSTGGGTALTAKASDRLQAIHSLMDAHPTGKTMRMGFSANNRTLRFVKFDRSTKSKTRIKRALSDSRLTARQFLRSNSTLLGLSSPDDEMKIKRQWRDEAGFSHFRFQQTVKGIPVWGREAMVHLDHADEIYLFQGRYEPSPGSEDIDTTPAITGDEAVQAASDHLGKPFTLDAAPELMFHTAPDGGMALVYRFALTVDITERWIYFVDAATGSVRHRLTGIRNQMVSSSGRDLNNTIQTFNAWRENSTEYLVDPSMPLADPPYAPVPELKSKGNTYILTADNSDGENLFHVTRPLTASWDAAGVSAASSVRKVYEYYKNTHGRDGIDDKSLNYLIVIHFGQNEANAFWNGKFVVLGDGDNQVFSSLAGALDVIAHEIQHGVTEFTAGLIYENQSGALNEAYSDIFACMVDRDDWTVGEDVTLASPGYLRSLSNPAAGYSSLPAKMSEYRNLPNTEDGDWGGVHINMSIPSRAAYLMAEGLTAEGGGTSIGRGKTEKIFYRALTTYLQASSGFQDARVATVQAAEDLYGAGSAEVSAVKLAWDGVEIYESGGGGTPDNNDPTPTDPISGQDMMIYLYPDDHSHTPWNAGETYTLWCQTIPSPFTGYTDGQDRKLYDGKVSHTRPAVYTDELGTLVFFVDALNNLWAVAADDPSSARQITDTGEIYSFAISPNGNYFAYTTPSMDDKNIYVGDLTTESETAYRLEPFSNLPPGDGGTINTIYYADSLAFDYSSRQIVFDALNCLSTPDSPCTGSDGGYRYWSIGLLNLTDGTFDYPFPNQSPDFDIGYPKFATNNNYVVALDLIDNTDYATSGTIYSSVWTMNWKDQTSHEIVDSNSGTEDYPIWGTPSFWGDDDYITTQVATNVGGTAYRIPIDASWQGYPQNAERINDYDVAMPVMHRVGVRTLSGTLTSSTTSVNFTNVPTGQTATRDITLRNTGNRDIRITNIAISGPSSFSHNGINTLLPQKESMTIRIAFSPTSGSGSQSGTLSITSDADTPQLNIALNGTASAGWHTISGSVSFNGSPVCAMVLANGQYMFSCEQGANFGKYELTVPLDRNEEITIQAFVSGKAPFKAVTDTSDLDVDIAIQTASEDAKSPSVTTVTDTNASTEPGWKRITGTVEYNGSPVCAMVLANGQYMFSCKANEGVYDLAVPLNKNGEATLYVFAAGFQPYKRVFVP
ncbi:MAG: hypothetical protein CR984_02525 [Proteobacteria bacterium]|nr:MAG: hypothetical protein CR984_02525 [Pseudomonadota bacterium]